MIGSCFLGELWLIHSGSSQISSGSSVIHQIFSGSSSPFYNTGQKVIKCLPMLMTRYKDKLQPDPKRMHHSYTRALRKWVLRYHLAELTNLSALTEKRKTYLSITTKAELRAGFSHCNLSYLSWKLVLISGRDKKVIHKHILTISKTQELSMK